MSVKAIFAHSGLPFWIDVAAYLRDKYRWEICYFIGAENTKQKALKAFPDAVFHSNRQANKNEIPLECNNIRHSPLDMDLLTALSFHESIFLKMMDRHNFDGSFTYNKRLFYYHSQVMYWKGVLDHFKPDIVVFRTAPHMGYDYILYALCTVLGVKTIMFERTSLPGLIYPVESFEKGSDAIREAYRKKLGKNTLDEVVLTETSKIHIDNLTKSYAQAMPFHLKYKLKNFRKGGSLEKPMTVFLLTFKDILKGLLLRSTDAGYLGKSYFKNIGIFKKRRLLAHYNKLAKDVDLDRPYIFVALQCEPERQTSPNGGVFGNQYVMIDLLSKIIPEGWMIYVKEHVSQFKSYQIAERARSIEFYNFIASLPNVEFVPLSYTSFDLIDKSMASATVSGTVGWESVVRGKSVLLFGYSWYRDCEGVFVTHTIRSLKKTLSVIQNGYYVDKTKVILFASVVEDVSFRGFIDKVYDKMDIVSPEENIANIARCINEFYHSQVQTIPHPDPAN